MLQDSGRVTVGGGGRREGSDSSYREFHEEVKTGALCEWLGRAGQGSQPCVHLFSVICVWVN